MIKNKYTGIAHGQELSYMNTETHIFTRTENGIAKWSRAYYSTVDQKDIETQELLNRIRENMKKLGLDTSDMSDDEMEVGIRRAKEIFGFSETGQEEFLAACYRLGQTGAGSK